MSAGILETLHDAYQIKVLALSPAILVDVHRRFVKEHVCVKPRSTGATCAVDGIKELLCTIRETKDIASLDCELQSVLRCIRSARVKEWIADGEPTPTAVMWIVVSTIIARLSQLDLSIKAVSGITTAIGDALKNLAAMPRCEDRDDSSIQVFSVVKALVTHLITSYPVRDKKYAVQLCTSLQLHVDEVIASLPLSAITKKGKTCAIEFCSEWVRTVSLVDAVRTMRVLLVKCSTSSAWNRSFTELLGGHPQVAVVLFKEVEDICAGKEDDLSYRRLCLDTISTCLSTIMTPVESSTVDKVLCVATVDSDPSLRSLAWKVLSSITGRLTVTQRTQIMTIARDALISDPTKSVGAALLKLLAVDEPSSEDNCVSKSVQEFVLLRMSQSDTLFPSSWIQDATRLVARSCHPVSPEVLLKAFSVADKCGKKLIAASYSERFTLLSSDQSVSELQCLAHCVQLDTIFDFEDFVDHLCLLCTASESVARVKLASASSAATRTLTEWSGYALHVDVTASLLLGSCLMKESFASCSTALIETVLHSSLKVLQAAAQVLESDEEHKNCELDAMISLRSVRRALRLTCPRNVHKLIETTLQLVMIPLVSNHKLQRETVKLIYALEKPQMKAYSCLALSQDEAFARGGRLKSFLTLVGVIASENAVYVAQLQAYHVQPTTTEEIDDNEEQPDEPKDYMESFKDSVALKNRIKNAKESSISDGLLSAYLPLVIRVIDSSPQIDITVAALWTLGEFMKFGTRITRVLQNDKAPVVSRMACMDVWAALQPTMKPSVAKEEGVDLVYSILKSAATSKAMLEHVLKRLQSLVLEAQLRDDRLHELSIFLTSTSEPIKSTAQHFFDKYVRKQPPTKIPTIIFEIYFALSGQECTKDIALTVARHLIELLGKYSISLDPLQAAVAEELDSSTRCLDAIRLLLHFSSLSVPALRKVTQSVERVVSYSSQMDICEAFRRLLAKQLQRTKGKSERAAIKEAISKASWREGTQECALARRVPLTVASIGRLRVDPE